MEPAMFSVASMFGSESGDDEDDAFVERDHTFPGLVLRIREFAFHQVNANLLWPGASIFAEWIVEHEELIKGHRVLELGSGTGALAIFLKKTLELDITTSDYDDVEIENNIRKNCELNNLAALPHIRHTWGEDFPCAIPDWDLIIASDILLYVKQYSNLIQTLCFLLKGYNLDSGEIEKQKPLPTKYFTTAVRDLQTTASIKALSTGPMTGNLTNSCDLTMESHTLCSDSCTIDSHYLPRTTSEQICSNDCQPGALNLASPPSIELTSPQKRCLPRPCFLMSWRRRIPKQEEALFFEGCRMAELVVIDFGSRIYCIHPQV